MLRCTTSWRRVVARARCASHAWIRIVHHKGHEGHKGKSSKSYCLQILALYLVNWSNSNWEEEALTLKTFVTFVSLVVRISNYTPAARILSLSSGD